MSPDFDIVIVGGGPAGSTAAMAAAKAGMKTMIIDRSAFPRDKTCGDAIAFTSLDILKELGVPSEKITNKKEYTLEKGIRFIYSENESLYFKNNLFFTLPRSIFDTVLWNAIPSTVEKHSSTEVKTIQSEGGFYKLEIYFEGELKLITTKYVIGADGYSSQIKRTLFKELNYQIRVASRYYLISEVTLTDTFDFYFLPEVTPGYFWIFRVGPNTYNTGVYLKKDGKPNEIFEIHNELTQRIFNRSLEKSLFHTWPIPNNMNFSNLVKDNALLIGDAAGICDIFLGQGIDSSIISGKTVISAILYFEGQNEKKYPLDEVYRYQLNGAIGYMIDRSEKIYDLIDKNQNNTFKILKEIFADLL